MGSGTFWEVPHSRNFVESLPRVEECFAFFCHSPLPGDWYLVLSYVAIVHEKTPYQKVGGYSELRTR